MPESRITCPRCPSYDKEGHRCRIGKANPKKKHESQTYAELFGVQALCLHNPHREPLILRMRRSDRRFVWSESTARRPAPPIEVEIIE